MSGQGVLGSGRLGQDDWVPVLDLSPRLTYRRQPQAPHPDQDLLPGALRVAGWDGVALPPAEVLGSLVVPVVSFTGAHARLRHSQGPTLHLETAEVWEVMPTTATPPAPLRIVGFVSTASRWGRALEQVRCLYGLGAGMVLSRRRTPSLQLMEADATGVWVIGAPPCEPQPRLWVTGRQGPVPTARRTVVTRLMEEALFGHALHHGLVS